MTDEDREKFKTLLLESKEDLRKKIEKLTKTDFGDDVDSLEQESDETEEMATNLSLSTSFGERLSEVETALEKIENGTYGICENCGNEISIELLEVDPESRLCKECKTKNG